jgi:hypothetical protein
MEDLRDGGAGPNRRWRRTGVAVALATLLSAGAGVAHAFTSVADPCVERSTTQVFAAWGDTNDYFLMAGGLFDNTSDWSRTGYSLVSKLPDLGSADPGMGGFSGDLGEPSFGSPSGSGDPSGGGSFSGLVVNVASVQPIASSELVASSAPPVGVANYRAGKALQPMPNDVRSVTSRTVCLRPNEPSVRFFYWDPGVAGATLAVSVLQLAHDDHPGIDGQEVLAQNVVAIQSVAGAPGWKLSPMVLTNAVYAPTADLFVAFQAMGGAWRIDNLYVDPFRSR